MSASWLLVTNKCIFVNIICTGWITLCTFGSYCARHFLHVPECLLTDQPELSKHSTGTLYIIIIIQHLFNEGTIFSRTSWILNIYLHIKHIHVLYSWLDGCYCKDQAAVWQPLYSKCTTVENHCGIMSCLVIPPAKIGKWGEWQGVTSSLLESENKRLQTLYVPEVGNRSTGELAGKMATQESGGAFSLCYGEIVRSWKLIGLNQFYSVGQIQWPCWGWAQPRSNTISNDTNSAQVKR